jgi:methanethiol S-methyltransferase
MSLATIHLLALAATWIGYFVLHSTFASLGLKRWVARRFPAWMPGYRLGFNLLALLLLIPPAWLTFSYDGPPLWIWKGAWKWIANGLALAALAGFFWSLRYYDSREFLGLRQWERRERGVEDQEHLHISPLHRFVRHPWYSLGLVLIWTRDMNAALFLSHLAITAYFVIGSRLEERKLVIYHGTAYLRYQARVPALVPSPWHHLTPDEARRLLEERDPSVDPRHSDAQRS